MSENVLRESGQETAASVHSGGGASRANPSQPSSEKLSGGDPAGYDATGGGSDAPLSTDADVDLDALVYVEEVNSNLVCCICQAPFWDPVVAPCGHTFCCVCIHQALQSSSAGTCPIDRSECKEGSLQPAAKIISDMTAELLVKCPRHMRGCSTVCQRQFVEHHVREECRYGVSSSSSSPGVRRLEKEIGPPSKNVEETCLRGEGDPGRRSSPEMGVCRRCRSSMAGSLLEGHAVRCPAKDVPCIRCKASLPCGELPRHYPSCPEVVVPCPHASYGCPWRGRRRDQPNHIAAECSFEPLKPLLQILTRKFSSLERENRDLRLQLTAVRSELAELRGRAVGSHDPPASLSAGGGGTPQPAHPSGDYAEYMNRSPAPPPFPAGMFAQTDADLPPEIRRGPHNTILASLQGYDLEGYFAAAPRIPWCEDHDSLRNQIENLAATVASLELKHNVTWMQECLRLREEVQTLRTVCHNTRSQVNALLLDTRNAAPAAAAAAVPASPALPVTKIAPANPSFPVVRAGSPDRVGADRRCARLSMGSSSGRPMRL